MDEFSSYFGSGRRLTTTDKGGKPPFIYFFIFLGAGPPFAEARRPF
jgi:hypothetical protein